MLQTTSDMHYGGPACCNAETLARLRLTPPSLPYTSALQAHLRSQRVGLSYVEHCNHPRKPLREGQPTSQGW